MSPLAKERDRLIAGVKSGGDHLRALGYKYSLLWMQTIAKLSPCEPSKDRHSRIIQTINLYY